MIKEQYIYINGKVIVETDEKKKIISPFKGFDEILSQENLVKEIQNKINNNKNMKLDLKSKNKSIIFEPVCIDILMVIFAILFLSMNVPIASLIYILMALLFSGLSISKYIKNNKTYKGIDSVIPYLEQELEHATEKLEELNAKEKEYIASKQEVYLGEIPSNQEKMEYIKRNQDLYYDSSYNNKKYILYYKLGILEEKLKQKHVTEEEFNRIEKCIASDAFHENDTFIRRLAINTIKKFR